MRVVALDDAPIGCADAGQSSTERARPIVGPSRKAEAAARSAPSAARRSWQSNATRRARAARNHRSRRPHHRFRSRQRLHQHRRRKSLPRRSRRNAQSSPRRVRRRSRRSPRRTLDAKSRRRLRARRRDRDHIRRPFSRDRQGWQSRAAITVRTSRTHGFERNTPCLSITSFSAVRKNSSTRAWCSSLAECLACGRPRTVATSRSRLRYVPAVGYFRSSFRSRAMRLRGPRRSRVCRWVGARCVRRS